MSQECVWMRRFAKIHQFCSQCQVRVKHGTKHWCSGINDCWLCKVRVQRCKRNRLERIYQWLLTVLTMCAALYKKSLRKKLPMVVDSVDSCAALYKKSSFLVEKPLPFSYPPGDKLLQVCTMKICMFDALYWLYCSSSRPVRITKNAQLCVTTDAASWADIAWSRILLRHKGIFGRVRMLTD